MTSIPARWAYIAVFVGVCGHASSEFFAVITGVTGPEVSVWRYLIGGAGLVLWALAQPATRDLISPCARRAGGSSRSRSSASRWPISPSTGHWTTPR